MPVPKRYIVTRREALLETRRLGRVLRKRFYTDMNMNSFVYSKFYAVLRSYIMLGLLYPFQSRDWKKVRQFFGQEISVKQD